jgi:aspartyl-tRNA(Asn)/glutamyl-tRNA(Gln) amidotransferase subunit A
MPTGSFAADPGAVTEFAAAVASGTLDVRELLERSLQRVAAVEPSVRGWRAIDADGAWAQAEMLSREVRAGRIRGPLHGIPVAIKDVIDVRGLPTRAGSATRANARPASIDATIVTELRAAGAVILGKAHTTEFAYFDGPPPTRNPWNLDHTPGGSSTGPAAAVAAGMVPASERRRPGR